LERLLGWTGATLGGVLGWWLAASAGYIFAFVASVAGTGIGLYCGRRLAAA
jgi:ABC-type lipoprotein release transport system permease subunit